MSVNVKSNGSTKTLLSKIVKIGAVAGNNTATITLDKNIYDYSVIILTARFVSGSKDFQSSSIVIGSDINRNLLANDRIMNVMPFDGTGHHQAEVKIKTKGDFKNILLQSCDVVTGASLYVID